MKLINLLLFIFLLTYSVSAQRFPVAGAYRFQGNDSTSFNTTGFGALRYDPVTGKYRFWNSLTSTWFSYGSGSGFDSTNFWRTKSDFTIPTQRVIQVPAGLTFAGLGRKELSVTNVGSFSIAPPSSIDVSTFSNSVLVSLSSNSSTRRLILGAELTTPAVTLQATSTGDDILFNANDQLRFNTASTQRFVINNVGALGIGGSPFYGVFGQVLISNGSGSAASWGTITSAHIDGSVAPTDSPSFSGTPLAPNAPDGNNSQQIATTAYVQSSSPKSIVVAASDELTALTTGTAKITFRVPYAITLTEVRASLTTAQSSGTILTVDVNEAGVSILSTKLTIDNTEETSTTALTPAVISDTTLADDAKITIDIDQIGDGTATGLKITLIGF